MVQGSFPGSFFNAVHRGILPLSNVGNPIPFFKVGRVITQLGIQLGNFGKLRHFSKSWSYHQCRPSPDQFFSQNKPRKIKSQNKRLLVDYLFTSTCFWGHWFPLENKLHFLNFPVGAGGVVVQKKPPNFSLLIFHREPPRRGFTALLGLP